MEGAEKLQNSSFYDRANIVSKLFYIWMLKLFKLGYSRDVILDDLCKTPAADEAGHVTARLRRKWEEEILLAKKRRRKVRLSRALVKTFWMEGSLLTFMLFIDEGLRIVQPLFISRIIDNFAHREQMSRLDLGLSSAGLILSIFLYSLVRHHYFQIGYHLSARIKTALTTLIFEKALRLSKGATNQTSVGQVLNIISNDLQRFDELCWLVWYMFITPVEAVLVLYLLARLLGVSLLAGFVCLLLFLPLQAFMGSLVKAFRLKGTVHTDKRIKLIGEVINAMRVVKMYCWEIHFTKKVMECRRLETKQIRNSYFINATNRTFFAIGTKLMLFSSLVTFVLTGNTLTAQITFVSLALFDTLRLPLTLHGPNSITFLMEASVACKRVQEVLLLEEVNTRHHETSAHKNVVGTAHMHKFFGKWVKQDKIPALKDLTLHISPGELVMVTGSVGCGKTCLLLAFLEEIEKASGVVCAIGKISYSPQESWCFNGTVRDNILFGQVFDSEKYAKVVHACGLEKDFELFPMGDQTFLGEKGHNLSGGQKARVTLARAVYVDADIYLLDDPLSAVDAAVGNHIFKKCIMQYLKGKTRVLVTHQIHFARKADKILVLSDGASIGYGSYAELSSAGIDFLSVVGQHENESDEKVAVNIDEIYKTLEPEAVPTKKKMTEENANEESMLTGAVKFSVLKQYAKAGSGCFIFSTTLFFTVVSQVFFQGSDYWLTLWTEGSTESSPLTGFRGGIRQTFHRLLGMDDNMNDIIVNGVLLVFVFITFLLRSALIYNTCLKASVHLHELMLNSVMHAPVAFFDNNPSGRILNRFTRDIGLMDQMVPQCVLDINFQMTACLGIVLISAIASPLLLVAALVLLLFSLPMRSFYIKTTRNIKRFEALSRSPVYTHISTAFTGLVLIRCFKLETKFEEQFTRLVNDNNGCLFLLQAAQRTLGLVLDILVAVFVGTIALYMIFFPDGILSSEVGLILSSALLLVNSFQFGIRQTSEFETHLVSVERVLEYKSLTPEPDWEVKETKPKENWPEKGLVDFKNVFLTYPRTAVPVLRDITFLVSPGYKIGIVGRTGAGKSSVISLLFRLTEFEGIVKLDEVNIKNIGLHDLRKKISIIPQDPILFSGSVRKNLDPSDEHSDEEIWRMLDSVRLKKLIQSLPGELAYEISENGGNLSVGQRQLVCLVRALLRKNRVLIMDEATANIDHETDALIQKVIKKHLKSCTVLTIAHRLNTIIDMDKILVLDAGRIVEYDAPYLLLQKPEGHFRKLVGQLENRLQKSLYETAQRAYRASHGL